MKLSVLILAGCLFASLGLAADPDSFAVINGAKAHPSRILARIKPGAADAPQARQVGAGYAIRREYKTVPGLILIEAAGQLQAKAGNTPEESGARLTAKINALQATGNYEYVEPDYVASATLNPPTDARFVDGTLWGLRNTGQDGGKAGADINVVPAWTNNIIGATNVIVAVIDTGVNYTHVELASQMWINPGEIPGNGIDDDGDGYVDNVYGINAIDDSGDPRDDHGHGSHVSGTIGAAANDGNGHVGVAWNVRIMACKFLGAGNFGFYSDAIQCIDFAVLKGAQISNNSWGGTGFSQGLLDSIAAAQSKGHLFIAAAGNADNDNDTSPFYPASFTLDNIISVAALDRNDLLADFSNFGIVSVDLGAPGVDIYSTWMGSDRAYNTISGTSMASPHVTGAAALLWGAQPGSDFATVKNLLLAGVTPISSLAGKTVTGGRLNVFKSLPPGKPDGILEVAVSPTENSFLRVGTNVPVFVTVSDAFGINNAIVTGKFAAFATNVDFRNDGQAPDIQANDATYSAEISTDLSPGSYSLSLTVTAPGKQDYTTNLTYRLVQPPSNDNFTNAQKILASGEVIDSDNRFATREKSEPNHAGVTNSSGSLWFSWSPLSASPVIIDTAGSVFDTVLAVYTGNSLATLKPVAATDNVGDKRNAYVKFDAKAAVTYWIAVAGARGSEVGGVHLRVELNGQPDDTSPVVTLTSPLSGSRIRNSDGKVVITGMAFDPQPNPSGVRQVSVKINDEIATTAFGTNNWSSTNLLQAGLNHIEVRASDYAENISAPLRFTLTYLTPTVTNDLFAFAVPLPGVIGSVTATNTTATKEFGEPNHGGNEGGHSLWYNWTAPTDGIFYISTEGSDIDSLLGVYKGRFANQLTALASSDDIPGDDFAEVITAVQGGTTYHIAVDGYAGITGKIQLNYNFSTNAVFSVRTSSAGNGTVSPTFAYYPFNSAVSVVAAPNNFYQFKQFTDKAGNVVSKENPYSFTITGPMELIAQFEPRVYTENFETGAFGPLWLAHDWIVQTNYASEGRFAARSQPIGDRASSRMVLNSYTAAGIGSFDYLVSSEEFFDKLQFRINDQLIGEWSGLGMRTAFSTYTFDVPDGLNTFQWTYIKDNALYNGLDAAFVDAIQLPPGHPALTVETTTQGGQTLRVSGQPLSQIGVQVSNDLKTWRQSVILATDAEGKAAWTVPADQSTGVAFYRLLDKR